ncbi:MAG: hypothetical protein AB3N21_12170 [Ruegeria sp.]|uniref:hypothetical protein n=1 Tax=Ruegeria sp. TaxID=1879320 RepID=UPI00349EDBC3
MRVDCSDTFVISWSQTELDGLEAAPLASLGVGAAWSWRGRVIRLGDRTDVSEWELAGDRYARAIRHGHGTRLERAAVGSVMDAAGRAGQSDQSFVVTNGARSYTVSVVHSGDGESPLLVFYGEMPPKDSDLWVSECAVSLPDVEWHMQAGQAVVLFAPGVRASASVSGKSDRQAPQVALAEPRVANGGAGRFTA